MANTLTGLIPTLYQSLDVVSREMVGFIPAVARNASGARAALDETITIPVAPTASTASNAPGVTAPDTGDQTIGKVDMTISKSKHVPIRFNGEEMLGLRNAGTMSGIMAGRFANAFRALVNEIETDIWNASYKAASRAYGTAGTAPFGTAGSLADTANVARILDDNGAPTSGRKLVLGSAAVANLRGVQNLLLKANEAGTDVLLRTGSIADAPVTGFMLHNSAAIGVHTKGAGTGYLVDLLAGYAVGTQTIHLDTGTVNTTGIKAGDVGTFTGDANIYVVNTGTTAVEDDIVIGAPGLRATLADGVALTIGNSYTPNVAFSENAIQLITRAPAAPEGGDGADDVMMLTDPFSGLTFEVSVYRQYRQVQYQVAIAWGCKTIKPEHVALLMG